ncbi:hypothetical protein K501DRAFT_300463 [Backusella circina FSU 941]|nr:hypothetical protein K501DRAFT_300463 [Backusella circina FSU 941]
MSHLNSNMMIHTPFGPPKRFIKDPFYTTSTSIDTQDGLEHDDISLPISRGSFDSRRSSFSSFSSAASSPRLGSYDRHRRPTSIKAAYERIEYLENVIFQEQKGIEDEERSKNLGGKVEVGIEDYQSVFKSMSSQIDHFLKTRHITDDAQNENTISDDQLDQLREFIYRQQQSNQCSQNSISDPSNLLKCIQDWIQQPKKALDNVEESSKKKDLKNERLIRALQRLGASHSALRKQTRTIPKLSKHISHITSKYTALKEEKTELEQLIDTLQHEMETMLEEVEQLKQDRNVYARKADTLERDMRTISSAGAYQSMDAMQSQLDVYQRQVHELQHIHQEDTNCMEKLRLENRQLTDSTYALKRDMARMTSKHESEMAVLSFEKMGLLKKVGQLSCQEQVPTSKKVEETKVVIQQQENTDLEIALRRTVAERDGQLAKLNLLLERKDREIQHVAQNKEKRIQSEIQARMRELQYQMTLRYQKENDALQLHLTRETRTLSYQMTDLELELVDAQRQLDAHHGEMQRREEEIKQGRVKVSKLMECIAQLEEKASIMEQETLHLYSRNLELTHQLGELDL